MNRAGVSGAVSIYDVVENGRLWVRFEGCLSMSRIDAGLHATAHSASEECGV